MTIPIKSPETVGEWKEKLESMRLMAKTDLTEIQNERRMGYNDCILDMQLFIPDLLLSREKETRLKLKQELIEKLPPELVDDVLLLID